MMSIKKLNAKYVTAGMSSERTYVYRISIGPLAELKYQLNTFFWSIFTLKSCSNYIAMDKNGQVFLDTQQGLIHDSYEKILLNPLIILIF